jgi:hypothetical protein
MTMPECSYCGAPLLGAQRFCVKCGREQDKPVKKSASGKEAPAPRKDTKPEQLECHKCGDMTERICYFCGKPICFHHTIKMQANALPTIEFKTAIEMGDHRRINSGWRGFIVSACSRCMSMNNGRSLTEEDLVEIRTVDRCSWFELKTKPVRY